jgi:hypothetical protein
VAAPEGDDAEPLGVYAATLEHQRASEAVELVRPLLSPRGTVELQPGGNTLVVRDSLAALARIAPVLRSFDHPPRPLRLEILVVRASTSPVSPAVPSDVPADLVERLRKLLRYDTFTLLARADLKTLEGEQVLYEMGGGYGVRFQLGSLFADERIKLHGFQVLRGDPATARPLIHTNLTLLVDQTVTLALAPREGSEKALMVVVTCRRPAAAAARARPPGRG